MLRDKKDVWVNLHMSLLRNAEGQAQCVLGLACDITEKKKEGQLTTAKEAAEAAAFAADLRQQVER